MITGRDRRDRLSAGKNRFVEPLVMSNFSKCTLQVLEMQGGDGITLALRHYKCLLGHLVKSGSGDPLAGVDARPTWIVWGVSQGRNWRGFEVKLSLCVASAVAAGANWVRFVFSFFGTAGGASGWLAAASARRARRSSCVLYRSRRARELALQEALVADELGERLLGS